MARIKHYNSETQSWEYSDVTGDAVLYTMQNLDDAEKAIARDNIGAASQIELASYADDSYVLFREQNLSEEQKEQARENIGAVSENDLILHTDNDYVLFCEQQLTEEQKAQARENIGAVGKDELSGAGGSADAVLYTMQNLTEEQKAQARVNIGAAREDAKLLPEIYLAENASGSLHYDQMEELFFFELNGELEIGKQYTVTFNGVEYTEVATESGVTGNEAGEHGVEISVPDVFGVIYFHNGWYGSTYNAAVWQHEKLGLDNQGLAIWKPAFLSIDEQESATVTTPDWNQNDETAPDYIKNRPFYVGTVMDYCVSPQTLDYSIGGAFATLNFMPNEGQTYILNVNGVEDHVVFEGGTMYSSKLGCEVTFDIGDDEATAEFVFSEPGVYTVSLGMQVNGVRRMDEKYLPATVVTTKSSITLTATFDDGSTATYQLYGKAVG